MSNENKTIHDFDFALICNYFKLLERQGPGSPEMTQLAASFLPALPEYAKIADLGCGTGGQTLTLARCVHGTITGLDLFPEFIEIFNRNAAEAGLQDRVKGIVGSMDDLPFAEESLDLIWSEGAIYNVGFENGLKLWRSYLKERGYIAVTEATWFTPERPAEINDFWMEAYPEIDTIAVNITKMQHAGYTPIAHFVLPDTCWTDQYYASQEAAREAFLKEYAGNVAAIDLIASQRHEESLYEKYKDYYGYVFYIGQKR